MPPTFKKACFPQVVEAGREMERRDKIARGNSWTDSAEECEEDSSNQFARRTMLSVQEQTSVQSNSASSPEDQPGTKPTCQQSMVDRRIRFMDRMRTALNSLPTIFSCSKNTNSSFSPQEGSLMGTPVAPTLEDKQIFRLKSSMRSSSSSEEELPKTSKMVAFNLVDVEKKAVEAGEEAIGQELVERIFPGQEEIEKQSAVFAQIQKQLSKKIKAISGNDSERAAIKAELQTKLNNLRAENNPETLLQRTEIKQELKRLKSIPETDPVKLKQIAQLYAEAYPQAREVAQQMVDWVQEDPERQHEFSALMLADTMMQVLEIASKTVAPHEIEPIKRDNLAFKSKTPFDIPYERTAFKVYEKHNFPSKDLEDEIMISAANYSLQNLQNFKKVLKKILDQGSPEEIENDLRQAQADKAEKCYELLREKYNFVDAKLALLTRKPVYIPPEEQNQVLVKELRNQLHDTHIVSYDFLNQSKEIRKSKLIANSPIIKSTAVTEALSLIP